MSITPCDRCARAEAKAWCIQSIVAAVRAADSAGSGAVSLRLLFDPGMLKVTYVTGPMRQRRFSTYGAAWTSCRMRRRPNEYGVSNIVVRMCVSRSNEL
jgi:hypothetical protein